LCRSKSREDSFTGKRAPKDINGDDIDDIKAYNFTSSLMQRVATLHVKQTFQ
jgi:hypothetical protein